MKSVFMAVAATETVLAMPLSVVGESWIIPRFTPNPPLLGNAVRQADVIFTGVTTRVDLSQYQGIGKGTYAGTVIPQTFLKGNLDQRELNLVWEPSATGIESGSNHIFFVRIKDGGFNVVKEIYVHDPKLGGTRTYGYYDGGTEATLQTIKLLDSPATSLPDYAATLLADLRQPSVQRQATAVRLACETLRPECLEPLLFAITHHVEDYANAIYGACRLDGKKGVAAALALVESQPDKQHTIFQAIALAKNAQSVPVLEQFGTDYPEYRASCAVAIGGIEPAKLPELVRRWNVDGKTSSEVRHFEGRVVQRTSGAFDVSNGHYCASFPKEKTAALASHLGKFVDVAFSVTGGMNRRGESFEAIQRITVIEETPEAFPIEVTIEPVKTVLTTLEPIMARVTLHNRSQQIQTLALSASHAVLSKDYKKVFWLEPDNHHYPDKSYRFEGEPDIGQMNPGGRLAFTIESRRMAEAGRYDLSYVVNLGASQRYCISGQAHVEIVAVAAVSREELLRSWLPRAALGQRIEIANELASKEDRWAVAEFLAQLKSGIYLGDGVFYRSAYAFAFKHGGEDGERLMMDLITHDKFQESATDFVRFAFLSKNRRRLFSELLSSQHAVEMNLQDWVKHPRICDITADVLMQSTNGKMQFPRQGSEAERNEAVARAQSALKANPEIFKGLKED